jgi:hypothetical protein
VQFFNVRGPANDAVEDAATEHDVCSLWSDRESREWRRQLVKGRGCSLQRATYVDVVSLSDAGCIPLDIPPVSGWQ